MSRELLRDRGASGINDSIDADVLKPLIDFCVNCTDRGVIGATTTLLGTATATATTAGVVGAAGAAAPVLAFAAMLIGPELWRAHKDSKRRSALDERFEEVLAYLRPLADNAADANRKLDALSAHTGRLEALLRVSCPQLLELGEDATDEQVLARANELANDGLSAFRDTYAADVPGLRERFDELRRGQEFQFVLLGELHGKADTVIEGMGRIEAQLAKIAALQEKILDLASKNTELVANNTRLADENTDLRQQLINANRELAEQRLEEGKSVDEVLAELRETDPRELFEFLRTSVADEEAAYAREMHERRERIIARHREIATIGFPLGEIDAAESSLRRILEHSENDLDAWNRLGHVHKLRGQLTDAERSYSRVLELTDSDEWRAKALGNLGLIEQTRGNLDAASEYHRRSLAIEEELGRHEGIASELGNLGLIEQTRGNLDAASDYHSRSLVIEEELGRREGIASDLGNLGLIERTRGNLDAASKYHRRSLAINEELGRREGVAIQLGNLGGIEQTRGNLDAASEFYHRSLAIDEELGRREGVAISLANLGGIEWARGNVDGARELWTRARDLFAEIGAIPQRDQTQQLLDALDNTDP